MATARKFSDLYNLVAQICQDQSSLGISNAKTAINTIIREITREFKLPEMMKGTANDVFVSPSVGNGAQKLTLANDVVRLENVWFIQGNEPYFLEEAQSDEEWLASIDTNTSGDPEIYRDFETDSLGNHTIQIWPSPNSSFLANANGQVFYSYWAQLVQLVNDSDVPNLPYELDTILVNGGCVEMARMQGDDTLMNLYAVKYEDDKGHLRAWLIKQREKDIQLEPAEPQGVFGRNQRKRGYKE